MNLLDSSLHHRIHRLVIIVCATRAIQDHQIRRQLLNGCLGMLLHPWAAITMQVTEASSCCGLDLNATNPVVLLYAGCHRRAHLSDALPPPQMHQQQPPSLQVWLGEELVHRGYQCGHKRRTNHDCAIISASSSRRLEHRRRLHQPT